MSPRPTQDEINKAARPGENTQDVTERLMKLRGKQQEQARAKPTEPFLFVPGFDIGAFPNHLNRSSLIAPIKRGPRNFHRQTKMVTRIDCVLEYTGEQLDEGDGDIIMALIAFAQPFQFGTTVPVTRVNLLRKLKRGTGSSDYKWLHRRMKALTEATLFIATKHYKVGNLEAFHIVDRFSYDEATGKYGFTLDERWVKLFGNNEYSLLDWDRRMLIGRDMGKTIQRLIATSSNRKQHYALDHLKEQMAYKSPMSKFKKALEVTCQELESLQIISGGVIEVNGKSELQLTLQLPSPPKSG